MKFVSIMGAYQTVLNSGYLHLAFFVAILAMPKHTEADFDNLIETSNLQLYQEAPEVVVSLNKALFELAWYGHFVVGLLALVATHFKQVTCLFLFCFATRKNNSNKL